MYVRQINVLELLLQSCHKFRPHLGVLIIGLEVVSLLSAGVTSHGANVDHSVTELEERASLDGNIQISNVMQNKLDEFLVSLLADPLDEAVGRQLLAQLEGRQAILGEAEVEQGGDGYTGGFADLLLLLFEVGAADEADGAFLAEGGEGGQDFGGGVL